MGRIGCGIGGYRSIVGMWRGRGDCGPVLRGFLCPRSTRQLTLIDVQTDVELRVGRKAEGKEGTSWRFLRNPSNLMKI